MVAGCSNPTRRVIEAGLMTVGLADGIALPSSYFLMIVPDFLGQGRKSFIFADCAVNADPAPPSSPILRSTSARSCDRRYSGNAAWPCCRFRPRAGAQHARVDKVREAMELVRQREPGTCDRRRVSG